MHSLYCGNLSPNWTEQKLQELLDWRDDVNMKIKIIVDRVRCCRWAVQCRDMAYDSQTTGLSVGYGFIELETKEEAEELLAARNGQPVPGAPSRTFKINWAQSSSSKTSVGPHKCVSRGCLGRGAVLGDARRRDDESGHAVVQRLRA